MKNITLSADEMLIETARERARTENTTLNELFRHWLIDYTQREQQAAEALVVMRALRGKLRVGQLTQDMANEH